MPKLSKNEFIKIIAPQAIRARREGSPLLPSVRVAQNLLETGGVLNSHNNLGGFKVGAGTPNEFWRGETYTTPTWEVIKGQRINTVATWRSYGSVYAFYRDQDRLFQSVRYARVRAAQTPEEQCKALRLCGYATDPLYADKLVTIIKAYGLTKYDEEAKLTMEKPDALAVIQSLQKLWGLESDKGKKEEIHRQANVVRKAAGIPLT